MLCFSSDNASEALVTPLGPEFHCSSKTGPHLSLLRVIIQLWLSSALTSCLKN